MFFSPNRNGKECRLLGLDVRSKLSRYSCEKRNEFDVAYDENVI